VIIWLDAQLSPQLAGWMEATFGIQCRHVRDLDLREAQDPEIMKNPAASSGVSEKHELPVLMELLIIATLLFDVVSYRGFVAMFSHRTAKIPVRPKLSSPQMLFDLRTQSETSRAVTLLITVTNFVTSYVGTDCTRK